MKIHVGSISCLYSNMVSCIMVRKLIMGVEDLRIYCLLGHFKLYKISCCFSPKHSTLRRRSLDNVFKLSDMST